jgi:PhnB protein
MPDRKNPAPEGSSIVSPYLIIASVEEEIKFLKNVFNAEVRESAKGEDGFIMHAEVKIGDSSIMMGRANENFPPIQSVLYIYVENTDEVYKKALENGGISTMEPDDRVYGNREAGVLDMQGNTFWIAQYLGKVEG